MIVTGALVWWIDSVLLHRAANGTDHAVRLAAILSYVGVDGADTLARALGIVALITSYSTVLLGLTVAARRTARPGNMVDLHRHLGALTLVLAVGHVVAPYASSLPPYGGWTTALVPWAQPASWGVEASTWQSLGILALYLLALTGPTYYLVGRRARAWRAVHYLSIAIYGLVVGHVLLLGTDFLVAGPPRWVLLGAQIPVLALLARRIAPAGSSGHRPWRWAGSVAAAAATVATMALTALSAAGEYAGGMRL